MRGIDLLGGCLILSLLGGCAVWSRPPAVDSPAPPTAERWQQGEQPGAPFDHRRWLEDFDDPQLLRLVSEGLAANPALSRTAARLAEGEAGVRVAGAPLQPTLDANLDAARSRRSSSTGHSTDNSFSAALALSWEADLWGKLSDSAQAAVTDWQALAFDLQAARLSLAANIAKGWFNLAEARQQLALSRRLVDNLADNLAVLDEGYRSGLFNALDIHLARANLAAERSRLAQRRQTLGERRRELELLLGRYPTGVFDSAAVLVDLPRAIPSGIPSDLLQRRPDIRAAALRFERDGQLLARRHKDRFPRLRLTANLGTSSSELGDLLQGSSLVWSLLAGLSQPLLDGGRLAAEEQRALAVAEQTRAGYIDTVLRAFSEVENALQQEQQLIQSVAALRESRDQSELAETLAFEQYRAGLVDFITVLEAQRRAFNARSSYLESRNRQLQNRINLYLALGGDFMGHDDLALGAPPAAVEQHP